MSTWQVILGIILWALVTDGIVTSLADAVVQNVGALKCWHPLTSQNARKNMQNDTNGAPEKHRDLLHENEVADGINVMIDDRFVAIFPMECRAQVEHLIKSVNLAHEQRLEARSR